MDLSEIDRLCDLFEQQRQLNHRYSIPEFLTQHQLSADPELLTELNRIAVDYGTVQNSDVTADAADPSPSLSNRMTGTAIDVGSTVGRYRLIRKLGEGGMGIVYLAVQSEPVQRQVALKLIRPGMNSVEVLARFNAERQALALMDHPNIARVFEGGTSEDGQPYFVMELVEGMPITQYGDLHDLPVSERLKLFVSVCHAVQHAHHKGVIHRDLKPSNILIKDIEQHASVRIIDFGLAKAVGPEFTNYPSCTRFGQIVGTIGYMSPEQASFNAVDIDTRTDVYSLGVLLYELLTGETPFGRNQLQDADVDELLRRIRQDDPPHPHARVSSHIARNDIAARRSTDSRRLSQLLRGELDWIVMKALEKDRNRRYETPNSLALDIEHFLHQKPLIAGPPGKVYQLRKFAVRNRGAVLASVVIIVSVLAGLVGTSIGLVRALTAERNTLIEQTLSSWDYGRQLCESGETGLGLLVLANAMESAPESAPGLRHALSLEVAAWYQQCDTLQAIFAHPDRVLTLATNPRQPFFVTGCADGVIRRFQYDSDSGQEVGSIGTPVCSMGFTPDGATLIVGGSDGRITWWDVASGQLTREIVAHQGEVCAIAISPDGRVMLTGGPDNSACMWDVVTGEKLNGFPFDGPVRAICISPDGNRCVLGGGNEASGRFCLYTLGHNSLNGPEFQQEVHRPVLSAAFGADGNSLLTGDADWETTFWDVPSGRPFAGSDFSNGRVTGIAISPDGRFAVTGASESHRAMVWDLQQLRSHWIRQKNGSVVLSRQSAPRPITPQLPHPAPVTAVAFADPEGKTFLTACEDGFVRLWRRAGGYSAHPIIHDDANRRPNAANHEFRIRAAIIDTSGTLAATAGEDGRICFWKIADGTSAASPIQCSAAIVSADFLADQPVLVTGHSDNMIRRWNLTQGEEIPPAVHYAPGISGLSLCQASGALLTGGGGTAQLWNAQSLKIRGDRLMHNPSDADVSVATAISPNGKRMLTCGEDGIARLWTKDGERIADLPHQNRIRCGAFSPDGRWAATASDDHSVKIWNAETGTHVSTLMHENEVFTVTFVSDEMILAGGRMGAQLWDHRLMRRIGPPCSTGDDVMCADSSPDGRTAVLGDWDGRGLIWTLPQPVSMRPGALPEWIQAEVGMRLDHSGGRETLSGAAWKTRRQRTEL
jgi:eukaryotic-like serine/threonine-protein kinase